MAAATLREDGLPAWLAQYRGRVAAPSCLRIFFSLLWTFFRRLHTVPLQSLSVLSLSLCPHSPSAVDLPAPVPTGRGRPPSGTRTARAGNKSRFHDSLPSSNAPNLSAPTPSPGPSVGARGAARAVPAVTAAARAPAGRGARGGEGSVAGRGGWGAGGVWRRVRSCGGRGGGGGGGRDLGAGKRVAGGGRGRCGAFTGLR